MDAITMETRGSPVDIETPRDIIPQRQEIINLEWTNVSYCTFGPKGEKKNIIHPMSGHAEPGKMLAIMGTSGAGKSTLLDILSGRLLSNNMSGLILANDKPISFSSFRKKTAYVKQSDSLFPYLTVKETLHYAAHLGIHGKTYVEREIAAMKTMCLLGLGHVQDTIIGDNSSRGLSGGEKRRVSIAVDIIHGPRLIFLDEPTSGLDSTTATTVIEALKGIAVTRNATLIVTIHQPSAKLYAMFDKCLFLSGGKVTYFGHCNGLLQYATRIYHKADLGTPPVTNAPELFLELCDTLAANDQLDLVVINTEMTTLNVEHYPAPISEENLTANNCFYEIFLLIHRNVKNIYRTKLLFIARIWLAIMFGFVIGSLFYNLPLTDDGVHERVGYLLFSIAFFLFSSMAALPVFIAEREIFQREYGKGSYRASSYVIATSLVVIPFLLVLNVAFIVPSYWLVMLPEDADTVFFYIMTLLLTTVAGQSFAVLLSVVVPDATAGLNAGSCILTAMYLMCGDIPSKVNIPVWWEWLHYISLYKYSYETVIINALRDKIVTPTRSNEEIMSYYSLTDISKWRGVVVLIGFTISHRIIIYCVLVKYYTDRRKE